MQVTIPPEIREGQSIRLKGEGESGENGGPAGDMYFRIHIREEKKQEKAVKETQKEPEKLQTETKQEAEKRTEAKAEAKPKKRKTASKPKKKKAETSSPEIDEDGMFGFLILLMMVGAATSVPVGAIWAIPLIIVLILLGLLLMKKKKAAGAWLGAFGSAVALFMMLLFIAGVVPPFVSIAGFIFIIGMCVSVKQIMTQIIRS